MSDVIEFSAEPPRWRGKVPRTVRAAETLPDRDEWIDFGGEVGSVHVDPTRPAPPPIHSPGDALAAHLRLIDWYQTHRDAANRIVGISVARMGGRPEDMPVTTEAAIIHAQAVTSAAETFYVSSHMVDLVTALANANGEGSIPLAFTDIPTPEGMVWLETPIQVTTDPLLCNRVVARAIAWQVRAAGDDRFATLPNGQQVVLHPNGESAMAALQARGGVLCWLYLDARSMLVEEGVWERAGKAPAVQHTLMAVPFGGWDGGDEEAMDRTGYIPCLFLSALFRLMWQRVITRERWWPSRQVRRQAERLRVGVDGERFTVTHLRRYEGHIEVRGESDGTVRQAHAVRGHWRDQWFRSLGPARLEDGSWNPDSHRRVWIDSHIRGMGPIREAAHPVTAVVR